ncbi:hypothetical protein GQ55_3G085700 [Panicum hallii var. hallii]|uniref:Kinetochore protein SPC25 n=1 Tax=Panicum hallii var. hallii TaxID=1504633 RepID=A0A2T7E746_9POAL|nr:hypothetical protein GQ55_3G085700 [Panicum hallii var. hallii]
MGQTIQPSPTTDLHAPTGQHKLQIQKVSGIPSLSSLAKNQKKNQRGERETLVVRVPGPLGAEQRMASSVEQQMAAALERAAPVATAPGGGGAGALDPQWRKTAAAALRGRMAAQRERGAGAAALASARSLALQALSRQGTREQLKGLKDQLRDLQSQLTETLSVQSCKESKGKLTTESISDATAMIERLGNSVADLRDKRDKRTTVISELLQALEPLEANTNEDAAVREKMEEAVFWYEKFLGFKIVGGEEGVKFVFNKVDPQSPEREYSFCINFDKDRYNSVLECDPHIKDVEKLVKDLNLSDNVVKFVRIIREKFQSSAMNGALPISPVVEPDVSAAPFPSPMVTSVDGRSEDVPNQSHSQSKKQSLPAKRGATVLSATSPGSLRRSSRAKGVR